MPDENGRMTQDESDAYEAQVAIMRQNKPPKRDDLPPITGVLNMEIEEGKLC